MKVKELVGSLNTAYGKSTKLFYFKSFTSKRSLSNGVNLGNAYIYWGEYTVNTWYPSTSSVIVIFINPDERRQ